MVQHACHVCMVAESAKSAPLEEHSEEHAAVVMLAWVRLFGIQPVMDRLCPPHSRAVRELRESAQAVGVG